MANMGPFSRPPAYYPGTDGREKEHEKNADNIKRAWIKKFKARKDKRKAGDSYNVTGDILSLEPYPLKELPVKLNTVIGNIVCFNLQSLNNFPKQMYGNIMLINCNISENDIRNQCEGEYVVYICEAKTSGLPPFRQIVPNR